MIRDRILCKSNEQIVRDIPAMNLLRTLGSDLNINVFAVNFRIKKVLNTDVEEANYLNNCIFKRLSITSPKMEPAKIPMFLSSTTFGVQDYGACVTKFKERLGLETHSTQDLFVLRNVVMSPFQTTRNFVEKIGNTFKETATEEVKVRLLFSVMPRQNVHDLFHSMSSRAILLSKRSTASLFNGSVTTRHSSPTSLTSTTQMAVSRSSSWCHSLTTLHRRLLTINHNIFSKRIPPSSRRSVSTEPNSLGISAYRTPQPFCLFSFS